MAKYHRREELSGKEVIESDAKKVIIKTNDKIIRILLSLLDSYPDCKRVTDIVSDTGHPQPTVSRYLTGYTGSKGHCFEECEDGWKLTPDGVFEIAKFLGIEREETIE